ncbi:hypothetical protein [Micromonospora sp. DT227]|uniref:hypothetical protein n=1 Tax=Micromonospora sp. DT227 TaxID=3393433 RepID=UPI003CFAACDA
MTPRPAAAKEAQRVAERRSRDVEIETERMQRDTCLQVADAREAQGRAEAAAGERAQAVRADLKDAQGELADVRVQLATATSRADVAHDRITRLDAQLTATTADRDAVRAELADLRTQFAVALARADVAQAATDRARHVEQAHMRAMEKLGWH